MGGCLSKKESTSTASPSPIVKTPLPDPPSKPLNNKLEEEKKKTISTTTSATTTTTTTTVVGHTEEGVKKKEVFVIKQRRSHERRPSEDKIKNYISTPGGGGSGVSNGGNGNILVGSGGAPVRTSSCTKEEVDAILIQCGRLSRSSSGNRKYSGSKRSYDFDFDHEKGDDPAAAANENRHQHHHHSRSSHRRTPSREKDVDSSKRSGSRDRYSSSRERINGGSGSRRVSRSPGRRSETPSSGATNATGDKSQRPGKMVSVPASVATTWGDKSIAVAAGGSESGTAAGVKRVSVKRSGEVGHRTKAASPRSQSPANVRASSNNENNNAQNQHQPGHTLSRSSSRKAEQSPYRRNPVTEIDDNCQKNETLKSQDHKVPQKSKETEQGLTKKPSHLQSQQKSDGRHNRATEVPQVTNNIVEDQAIEEAKGGLSQKGSKVAAGGATESLKPQGITRSRSSRRSRDLDINLGLDPDTVLNPTSYASLLLEDIQNFHQQKNTPAPAGAPTTFSLPACVTKACSILDAVADLNSCNSSNLSSTFSNEDRSCYETDRSSNNKNFNRGTNVVFNPLGKKRLEVKNPFVESELVVEDDLMEPSLHKYITVRRGVNIVTGGEEKEMEQQESSGSNSYVGHQHWVSSSSWEPNSADSTDRWTSRSNTTGEEEPSLLINEKQQKPQQTISATPIRRKRETTDHLRQVGGGGGGKGQMTIPIAAASM